MQLTGVRGLALLAGGLRNPTGLPSAEGLADGQEKAERTVKPEAGGAATPAARRRGRCRRRGVSDGEQLVRDSQGPSARSARGIVGGRPGYGRASDP